MRLFEKRGSILIVDDDEDNLLMLQYALEEMGYSIVQARSGREAMALASSCLPKLILLDIRLPDINGIAVIKHLKRQPETQAIPIIAVTALASTVDRARILAAGFADYLSKPYMLDELAELISLHLSPEG